MSISWPWLNAHGGAPFRYWLGWGGFGVMCLTNLYILRKKLPALREVGKAARWLDFHIFCGLVGPTLVVFHTNFHINGLVAISFWSMMISAGSGVVGRYFYTQLLQHRGLIRGDIRRYDAGFAQLEKMAPQIYADGTINAVKQTAIRMAFGGHELKDIPSNLAAVLYYSLLGDLEFYLKPLTVPAGVSTAVQRKLKEYGMMQRKLALLDAYKRLMGYWHTFHIPFAIFMYVVAVIHIIAELLFRVH
jgi:hypothetical protein